MRRAVGGLSRRLGRPELLAAVDPQARRTEREAIGISALLAGALGDEDTYVDVGTNRGQVLREALRVAPRGRHIAFEPIPALAEMLAASFPAVESRRLALGAEPHVAQFCHFTKLDGWSGLRRSPEISDDLGRPEFIDVRVSTLDIEMAGLTPAVIKIDVEGGELAVLEGGRSILADARPLLIFEHVPQAAELYGASSGAIWDLLADLGYTVFSATGEGPVGREAFMAAESGVVNWMARAR
ncbi:MAG: FkbM family methyltransferase [Solirubrobacteraceae bacterium]